MKYLADTHMHSIYSYDGQMKIENMIKRGEELGLKYMAFTEHLEFSQLTWKQFFNRYQIYSEELDYLQEEHPTIKLLKGVEFSNPEMYLEELEQVNKLDLDYIIGSNHIYPQNNTREGILLYYKRILEMVKNGGIDCLGHMDYIRRRLDDSLLNDDIFLEIFDNMISRDIALEINSSAIRRKQLDSFPSMEKMRLYEKMGGTKVTIGSDAHCLNQIYDSIDVIDQTYDFNKGVYVKRKFMSLTTKAE